MTPTEEDIRQVVSAVREWRAQVATLAREVGELQGQMRELRETVTTLAEQAATKDADRKHGLAEGLAEWLRVARQQVTGTEGPPICRVHNEYLRKRPGKYGSFWACQRKERDGSWCRYKPPKR